MIKSPNLYDHRTKEIIALVLHLQMKDLATDSYISTSVLCVSSSTSTCMLNSSLYLPPSFEVQSEVYSSLCTLTSCLWIVLVQTVG